MMDRRTAHAVRSLLDARPARWTRFHSLPGAKRYPSHRGEWTELLHRHNTILDAALTDGAPAWLVMTSWGEDERPEELEHHLSRHPFAVLRHRRSQNGVASVQHVAPIVWRTGGEDPLLRAIADEELTEVHFLDRAATVCVRPYDGGLDLTGDAARVGALRRAHAPWLPGATPLADPMTMLPFTHPTEREVVRGLLRRQATVYLDAADRIHHLRIPPAAVDDRLLAQLGQLSGLVYLWFQETRTPCPAAEVFAPSPEVSDAGLAQLTQLPGLRLLYCGPLPQVSAEGMAGFRAALPDCEVVVVD